MESLCHACPAIAFDVPYGPSHLIVHGETGLLAPFGDTEALAEQIISVFDDNEFHKRMSGKAFALANRFSHAEAARHWRQLFSAVGVLS
jgi:poly(glycerol-phosphate) alpha-glucosyltransferase